MRPINPLFTLLISTLVSFVPLISHANIHYKGVNLASAEFGPQYLPGRYNHHYSYPNHLEIDYFTQQGMNTFRLPFLWERLQHNAYDKLNWLELLRIKQFVDYTSKKSAYTILDVHNYARYHGGVIGTENTPTSEFEDFWTKLALEFKNHPFVIFGLMNEPHHMKTELWLRNANAAILAIRKTGASNLILVPGNGYSTAETWTRSYYGTPNSIVMLNITDPMNNYAYEVHQYFDKNSSGKSDECISETVGQTRLVEFTRWLRVNNKRGFLGEFGVGQNETCLKSLDSMLDYVHGHSDVWSGWTYWAAGPRWNNYIYSIQPKHGNDMPQMSVLKQYLNKQP